MSVFAFLFWYFPMGLYRNAEYTDAVHSRGIAVFFNIWAFFVFSSTFGQMIIAGIDTAEVAGGIVNLFFILMVAFAGFVANLSFLLGPFLLGYSLLTPRQRSRHSRRTPRVLDLHVSCEPFHVYHRGPRRDHLGRHAAPLPRQRAGAV